jgi:hypothetical protein
LLVDRSERAGCDVAGVDRDGRLAGAAADDQVGSCLANLDAAEAAETAA